MVLYQALSSHFGQTYSFVERESVSLHQLRKLRVPSCDTLKVLVKKNFYVITTMELYEYFQGQLDFFHS